MKPTKSLFARKTLIATAIAALTPLVGPAAVAQSQDGLFELGGLHTGTSPYGISADGNVVIGESRTKSGSLHAFRWTEGISDLGTLGGLNSSATGVSADGSVVVGDWTTDNYRPRAFRWSETAGMVDLGTLGGVESITAGVSADGSVVVGASSTTDGNIHAFRWTTTNGMIDLGHLGSGRSLATAVSADGRVVVGESNPNNSYEHAFRWTQAGGMSDLGTLGGLFSSATAVSANGSVVVGDSAIDNLGTPHAFRWSTTTGMVDLGTLGGRDSSAIGVSADGRVVVGNSSTTDGIPSRAFRWTQAGGMVDLGPLERMASFTSALSADGRVVVGAYATNGRMRAFRWTQATGMQSVEDWLRAKGIAVASDMTYNATATNRDGSVVVGQTYDSQGFIARVSSDGSGLVTLADVQQSLHATGQGNAMALSFAGTAINGAHSRPLSRRVAAGQRNFWLAGDWGRDDHGARSGELGLAEAGLGYNFGPAQVNVSLGQTWAKQNLTLNGHAKIDGTYLQAEAISPLAGSLWATLGAYGHWGDADLRRGYLNAGAPDYSAATPGIKLWGVRARLDWDNALQAANAEFSPYVDLTYSESKLAAYTETGGGFPARFDARQDKATEFRLGVNSTYPLAGSLRLLGTLETVHRFEKHGARTSGEVLGMFDFDLPGQSHKQDWLRVVAGLEGPFAGGKASLSVNATTPGSAPNVWLAANWQLSF